MLALDAANRAEKRMYIAILHHERRGPHASGMRCVFVRGVSGVHDELQVGRLGVQALEHAKSTRVPETQIQNEHVRCPATRLVESLGTGAHRADEFQLGIQAYELAEDARDVRVVIHDEHASARGR